MPIIISILVGVIFGAGLTLSDMVNPARVLNFLDVAGSWDPTLAFVMIGGLVVTTFGYKLIFRRDAPLFCDRFSLPTQRQIDVPLVGGAALFGIGWGLVGICPGPALTDLMTLQPKLWLFVAAMLAGTLVASIVRDRTSATKSSKRAYETESEVAT